MTESVSSFTLLLSSVETREQFPSTCIRLSVTVSLLVRGELFSPNTSFLKAGQNDCEEGSGNVHPQGLAYLATAMVEVVLDLVAKVHMVLLL